MLFTFENRVPLMRYGASVVWHHSLILMNGFNKTEAAVFSCRLCFLRAFHFISFFNNIIIQIIVILFKCALVFRITKFNIKKSVPLKQLIVILLLMAFFR